MEATVQKPKRTRKSKPTAMQIVAVNKTIENLGSEHPKSQGQILREVGFSEAVAQNPQIVTESKGFRELLNEAIPDGLLTKVHLEGLKATKLSNSLTAPDMEIPDYPTRHKYLKTAYEVKGLIAPVVATAPIVTTYNLFYQPQVQQCVKAFEQDIKSLIANEHVQQTEAPLATE